MSALSSKVTLNGIWSDRIKPLGVHPEAEAPSDPASLASHVVNTQGIERLSTRPAETIAQEIEESRIKGTDPFAPLSVPSPSVPPANVPPTGAPKSKEKP